MLDKRNNLQTKIWQSVCLQWHQKLCIKLIKDGQNTYLNFKCAFLVSSKHGGKFRLEMRKIRHPMYHSQAVGHRKRCDETALHKMCNVTHLLLVMGKDVMRLPFTKCAMSLTCCWS